MFNIKELTFSMFLWGVVMIAGTEAVRSSERYYPHCSPIAHEIQEAWHRGELTERDARGLIERCLQAEERGAFEY